MMALVACVRERAIVRVMTGIKINMAFVAIPEYEEAR